MEIIEFLLSWFGGGPMEVTNQEEEGDSRSIMMLDKA